MHSEKAHLSFNVNIEAYIIKMFCINWCQRYRISNSCNYEKNIRFVFLFIDNLLDILNFIEFRCICLNCSHMLLPTLSTYGNKYIGTFGYEMLISSQINILNLISNKTKFSIELCYLYFTVDSFFETIDSKRVHSCISSWRIVYLYRYI